jgi:hypothetical protein
MQCNDLFLGIQQQLLADVYANLLKPLPVSTIDASLTSISNRLAYYRRIRGIIRGSFNNMKIEFNKLPKVMFYLSLTASVYTYGALSYKYNLPPFPQIRDAIQNVFLVFDEFGNITRLQPTSFLQPARYQGNGVTVNEFPVHNQELILLSGFFENDNGLRLIKRNGEVVAHWKALFSDIFPDTSHLIKPPATDWNVDIHGALVLPDGSVVFNFEYAGLVKLDRCGNVVWTLPSITHHSVERSEQGGFWVPGTRIHMESTKSNFPPFRLPFSEDTILRISEDGEIMREISVPGLFYRSGLDSLLTATGHKFTEDMGWDNEIVHLNKIAELSSKLADKFPLFETGDLLLSIRELNLVMVVDPESETIKWWQIGPWLRQHDPEFKDDGMLTVFNNNIYRTAFGAKDKEKISPVTAPRISNIVEINPETRQYSVLYGGTADQELLTIIRGKHENTTDGGLLITEFEGGRVVETDTNGHIVWEYVNRHDSNLVAEITEARVYSHDYFTTSNWSCE